jgi:antitoxin CptB
MLELELVLLSFLDNRYAQLGSGERQSFCRLLDLADAELWDFLDGRAAPGDPGLAGLVAKLRETYMRL